MFIAAKSHRRTSNALHRHNNSHVTHACATITTSPQVLRAHILPLTNCAFNKSGDRFITGSYDRTCKVRLSSPGASSGAAAAQAHAAATACYDLLQCMWCKQVWNTYTGEDMFTLEGHKNVVSTAGLCSAGWAVTAKRSSCGVHP